MLPTPRSLVHLEAIAEGIAAAGAVWPAAAAHRWLHPSRLAARR